MTLQDLRIFFNQHKPKSTLGINELALAQTPISNGIAIDLCCGAGKLTQLLRERGIKAYGVDISDQFIGTATPDRAGFAVGNVEMIPFASECGQLVYCIDSLQYFQQPEQVLKEMARVLESGGYLIFSTQNNYNLAGIKRWFMERITGKTWSPWLAHPIENHLTYPQLMRYLDQAGFEVEYIRGQQFITTLVSLLPSFIRHWTPDKSKSWRSLASMGQRVRLPNIIEESWLARFAMIVFVRARKR
jgi:ubiquinone/menaquinone biosynthesis C-methylase UbiE